ncbi:MAG: chloride channel protein [Thermoguttaceae bacterium]|nr:chloride channel protein [Thermoguttaceae bacterium]
MSPPVRQAFRELLDGFRDKRRKVFLALTVGLAAGAAGMAFRVSIFQMNALRIAHPWLLYTLPIAGPLIFLMYRLARYRREPGVDTIFSSIRSGEKLRFPQAPLVFLASCLTHLCGGSAGREGAVLELGACIGAKGTRLLGWGKKLKKLSVLCGMVGAFSALFGAPLTAFFFVMEITGPKVFHYRGGIFSLLSALAAFFLLVPFGLVPPALSVSTLPALDFGRLFLILILAAGCGLVGIFYCLTMRFIPLGLAALTGNGYLRAFLGGAMILTLTLLSGARQCCGLSGEMLLGALGGCALAADPLRKTVLTAVTLGSGFKGGDLVPAMVVGASAGALLAGPLGLPGPFCAALGLIALFCVVTRCRLAAIFLALELFGATMALYAIGIAVVTYLFSGSWSLFRVR